VAGIRAALRAGEEHTCVLLNQRKDGTPWWNELHLSPVHDDHGRLTHYLGFQYDVTTRVQAEQQLLKLSSQDGLTGLLNRSALIEHLDVAVARDALAGRSLAVLFLDLDGFKAVNDTHGHLAGDRALAEVAARLRTCLRADDALARHGGDEFVAVLGGLDPLDADRVAERVAQELLAALQRPVPVGSDVAHLGASVGLALLGRDGTTGPELLQAADAAMYLRKGASRGLPPQRLPHGS
jgi:diguanylate cyclase (GGDEF)-like protein